MIRNIAGWFWGILLSMIALINIFWGNDSIFGIFLLALALTYFPRIDLLITKKTGIRLPPWSKIAIALFIIWSSVGVGELFDKIDMMLQTFKRF
jgi:hypothetical protein